MTTVSPLTIDPLKFALSHLPWLVLTASAFVGFEYWRSEHDAKLLATQELKISEARVSGLQQAIADRDKQTAAQLAPVVKIVHDTQTVPQATAALPSVLTAPLPLPIQQQNQGWFIPQPDVLPLFQQIADDKICRSLLDTCTKDLTDTRGIVSERDTEIATLKKPKPFWGRVRRTAEIVAIAAGTGYLLGKKF